MNIFEQASRKKYRFDSSVGQLTVEQLWDLPLKAKNLLDLDHVARAVNAQVKQDQDNESFVEVKTTTNTDLPNKLEIVKHIIAIRLAEQDARATATAKAEQKRRLLEVLHEKKQGELQNLTVEEIEKQIAAL